MKSAHWLASLLALVLMFSAISHAMEARTYTLSNRAASDVAEQLRDLYPQDQLALTARGQQLVVRGSPQVLDEVSLLIGTLDIAPHQLRITVRSGGSGDARQDSAGVTLRNTQGQVNVERRVTTTQRQQEQSLVVQDGQSAHIRAGQVRALPVAMRGGRNPALILQQTDISSGFIITPQVISEQTVELQVMAFDNTPEAGVAGYKTEAVMTIRRVPAGQWVELGSVETEQSGSQSGILYRTGDQRQQSQRFEVRVDVL